MDLAFAEIFRAVFAEGIDGAAAGVFAEIVGGELGGLPEEGAELWGGLVGWECPGGEGGLTSERAWKAVSLVERVIDMLCGVW